MITFRAFSFLSTSIEWLEIPERVGDGILLVSTSLVGMPPAAIFTIPTCSLALSESTLHLSSTAVDEF